MIQEGTETETADALARRFASMGGSLSVSVGSDSVAVSADVLKDRGPEAVALIAEVVRSPRLPEDALGRLKASLARTLAINRSGPQATAEEKFDALLYGDHPYGRTFPTEAMLKGYTLDQVRGITRRFLRSQSRATLCRRRVRCAPDDPRDRRGLLGVAERRPGDDAAGTHPAAAVVRAHRSAGRAAVHRVCRGAGPRSVAGGLARPAGDRRAARRGRLPRGSPRTSASRRATRIHPSAPSTRTSRPRTGSRSPMSRRTSPVRPSKRSLRRSIA